MVTLIEVPPQKAPKQLTARVPSHNLHEHFLAFLNVNNATGFTADEIAPIEAETIVELLVTVSQYDVVPEWKFKKLAKRLKKTSDGTIKHGRALDIVSRVFGYTHWYEASKVCATSEGVFVNKRDRSTFNLQKLLGL